MAKKFQLQRKGLVVKLKSWRIHHKIMVTSCGLVGIVLVWRGVWALSDHTPFINHPVISLILGLVLVGISGVFFKLI